jgi:hypothetical protein
MRGRYGFALLLIVATLDASASLKVINTAPGAVAGTLSYASGQYWLAAGKETMCVMVDPDDEAALAPLAGKKVEFSGPIQTWSDHSRCIVVGPAFPQAARVPAPMLGKARPVTIGAHGQPDIDACPSVGAALSSVAVRLAPATVAGVAARLDTGQSFYMCGSSPDGVWESVVIPASAGADCGVSGAVAKPRPYRGPCKSGWVEAKYIEVVAG